MLHGIRDQVLDALLDALSIAGHDDLGHRPRNDVVIRSGKRPRYFARDAPQIDGLHVDVEDPLIEPCNVEKVCDQPAETTDPAYRGVRFPDVVLPSVAFGTAADEVQPRADWREVVSQIVRQHGDQVLCHGPATLLDCVPRYLLHQLGVASDHPDPARDELGEGGIRGAEEIRLQRRDHHHPAAAAADLERNAELRLDLQTGLDAAQLLAVLIEPARQEGLSGLKNVDDAPAVGNREDVQAELFLEIRKRLRARAKRDERVPRFVVQERVDLVGLQGVRNRIARVCQRRLQLGGRDRQQLFQRCEKPLGIRLGWHRRNLHPIGRAGDCDLGVAPNQRDAEAALQPVARPPGGNLDDRSTRLIPLVADSTS